MASSFVFSNSNPSPEWQNVQQLRQQSRNSTLFDYDLWLSLQFFTPNNSVTEDEMWQIFDSTINRLLLLLLINNHLSGFVIINHISDFVSLSFFISLYYRLNSIYFYKPVFIDATLDAFQKLVDDNIQHVEIRGIHGIYDLVPPYTYNSTSAVRLWLDLLRRMFCGLIFVH
jgi:hypothetical protein